MPKGLKTTSSPIQISQRIRATTSGSVETVRERVDLQLNPLDNEVFVVTGVKIDFTSPVLRSITSPGQYQLSQTCSVSKIEETGMPELDNPSVVATSKISAYSLQDPAGDVYTALETNSMDTPPASQDYLDIIATNDFYLIYQITDNYVTGQTTGANVRVYGYRATADSSTYAALVQSEMLSR